MPLNRIQMRKIDTRNRQISSPQQSTVSSSISLTNQCKRCDQQTPTTNDAEMIPHPLSFLAPVQHITRNRRPQRKYFKILIRGRQTSISIDQLKHAFAANDDLKSAVQPLAVSSRSLIEPNIDDSIHENTPQLSTSMKTTRSGRKVTTPNRFK